MKCTCAAFKKGGVRFTLLRDRDCPTHGDYQEPEPEGIAHQDDAALRLVEKQEQASRDALNTKDTYESGH